MKSKFFVITLSLFLVLFTAPVAAAYTPHVGDHFSYHEVQNLGSGTGDYAGYSEQTTINGMETVNGINADGTVSANYSYSYTWVNSTGTTETGNPSGIFTFSPVTFLYVNGTDEQTGYVNPTVWFCMDNSIPNGGTFSLLNTEMTVISMNYSYYLPSQNRNVNAIFAQGTSSSQRDDVYGQFSVDYTWKAYFDPSTGYIIGYNYDEQDTNSSGTEFTYTENLYVNSTSYPLTEAAAGNPSGGSSSPVATNSVGENSGPAQYFIIVFAVIIVLVLIAILIYALSRRRTLPKHGSQQPYQQAYQQSPPPPGPPPESIDLTPKQPAVQQIVIKEVVKVKCHYCGALIDSTAQICPICGAPRT